MVRRRVRDPLAGRRRAQDQESSRDRRRPSSYAAQIAAAAILLLSTGLICAGGAAAAPAAVPVVAAERRDLPVYVYAPGTVQASQAVIIRSRVDGIVTQAYFREGEQVAADAPLFEIDPTLYRAEADRAEATVQKDEATLVRARADLQRGTDLTGRGFQARKDFDQQAATVAELEATVKADRAALASAHARLAWTTIRAPIAGRVGRRLVDIGNLVQAVNGTPLTDLVQLDPVNVVFDIAQEHLNEIQAELSNGALPVAIQSLAERQNVAFGHSLLLYNNVDQMTGTAKLRVLVDNPDRQFWPSEAVDVRMVVAMRHDVVSIPERALFEAAAGTAVYLVDSSNHLALRPVKTGPRADGLIAIENGLATGDRVVTADQERLAPGQEVVPQSDLAATK
jgi:membrane fusion protein, multidrug efflux system